MPDPIDLTGTMRGLADVIALSPDNFDPVTGDARNMSGRSRGGNDFMTGASSMAVSPAYNTFMGDAILMTDDSRGGNDRLICGSNAVNIIYGDAETLTGRAIGGNDVLEGIATPTIRFVGLCGDGYNLAGFSRGGNDRLMLNGQLLGSASGDGLYLMDNARGGNDFIAGQTSAGARITLSGDALLYLSDNAGGGNDRILGPSAAVEAMITGDAATMLGTARGGNDFLVAGDGGVNTLCGDAMGAIGPTCRSGNDVLVAGTGIDFLYGDFIESRDGTPGGRDIFRFGPGTGALDSIGDFQPGLDHIEISRRTGILDFDDLVITPAIYEPGLRIDLGNGDAVTVLAVTVLTEDDFIFR